MPLVLRQRSDCPCRWARARLCLWIAAAGRIVHTEAVLAERHPERPGGAGDQGLPVVEWVPPHPCAPTRVWSQKPEGVAGRSAPTLCRLLASCRELRPRVASTPCHRGSGQRAVAHARPRRAWTHTAQVHRMSACEIMLQLPLPLPMPPVRRQIGGYRVRAPTKPGAAPPSPPADRKPSALSVPAPGSPQSADWGPPGLGVDEAGGSWPDRLRARPQLSYGVRWRVAAARSQ